jgi:hypothetical protein
MRYSLMCGCKSFVLSPTKIGILSQLMRFHPGSPLWLPRKSKGNQRHRFFAASLTVFFSENLDGEFLKTIRIAKKSDYIADEYVSNNPSCPLPWSGSIAPMPLTAQDNR